MELSGEGPDRIKSRQDAHFLRYFMVPGCKNTSIVRFNNTFFCRFFSISGRGINLQFLLGMVRYGSSKME